MRAIVFVAQGTEEMEFTIAYDVLVRGGIQVQSVYVPADGAPASPPEGFVRAARGVAIVPDTTLEQCAAANHAYDLLVVPGGVGGADIISHNPIVLSMLRDAYAAGTWIGMICAGSLAALEAQIGEHGGITSHPSVADKLEKAYEYREEPVVVAKNLVTSRGPGTSFAFALTLVEKLAGREVRDQVAAPMMLMERL
ncbi:protein deglycase [Malassezia vespertilionis]|uniref:protein deglycase n=1 Tax=Malassezia vespertilionis TaxID=2020962 RepID=UPI0024B0E806|nr:protein deglycase [Malassezia vespertilionis]WFD08220.1 protein deglycase [Malassezia vespertilionis]